MIGAIRKDDSPYPPPFSEALKHSDAALLKQSAQCSYEPVAVVMIPVPMGIYVDADCVGIKAIEDSAVSQKLVVSTY